MLSLSTNTRPLLTHHIRRVLAETRKKLSESMKRLWSNSTYVELRRAKAEVFYGSYSANPGKVSFKSHSDETRQRISDTLKKRWADKEFRVKALARMAEVRAGRAREHGALCGELCCERANRNKSRKAL